MVIIGIDPGTAATGYGVIANYRGKLKLIEYGCITTPKKDRPEARLLEIYRDLEKIIKKYRPERIAVESIFFFKNLKTAISVAQARGVILLAATKQRVPVLEFTPLQIKSSLTGYGKADKKQVQYMVKAVLGLKSIPKPDDAADALAIAICAANRKEIK